MIRNTSRKTTVSMADFERIKVKEVRENNTDINL